MQHRLKIAILILLFCGVFVVNLSPHQNATDVGRGLRIVMAQDQGSYAINIEPLRRGGEKQIDFVQYIIRFYDLGLKIAGALALMMIVFGGLMIAISGAINKQQEGRDMIWSALWGLVLLVGANLILRTINPQLVNKKGGYELKMPSGVKETPELLTRKAATLCTTENSTKKDNKDNYLYPEAHLDATGQSIKECDKGKKEKPELVESKNEDGQKITYCSCLTKILDKVCVGRPIIECMPKKVELYGKSQKAEDFLSSYFYFEKEGGGLQLKRIGEKIGEDELKNGVVVYRYPFYRAKGQNDSVELGASTARCIIYAYIKLDKDGKKISSENLPLKNNNETWKPCDFDETKLEEYLKEMGPGFKDFVDINKDSKIIREDENENEESPEPEPKTQTQESQTQPVEPGTKPFIPSPQE